LKPGIGHNQDCTASPGFNTVGHLGHNEHITVEIEPGEEEREAGTSIPEDTAGPCTHEAEMDTKSPLKERGDKGDVVPLHARKWVKVEITRGGIKAQLVR